MRLGLLTATSVRRKRSLKRVHDFSKAFEVDLAILVSLKLTNRVAKS
jgi:hypothetical protein